MNDEEWMESADNKQGLWEILNELRTLSLDEKTDIIVKMGEPGNGEYPRLIVGWEYGELGDNEIDLLDESEED